MGLRQNIVGWAVLLAAVAAPSSSLNFDLAVDLGMFDPVDQARPDDFLAFSGSDASHAWMHVGSGGVSV